VIFARENSDDLTSLVKKIDAESKINSFIVYLSDDEKFQNGLKGFAEKNKIEHTILSIDNPAGPKGYNIAKEADVTVLLYKGKKVEANHAFRKGELNSGAIERVIADLAKIRK